MISNIGLDILTCDVYIPVIAYQSLLIFKVLYLMSLTYA